MASMGQDSQAPTLPPFLDERGSRGGRSAKARMANMQGLIPTSLKERFVLLLAVRGETYAGWLEEQISLWIQEHEAATRAMFLAQTAPPYPHGQDE